MVSLSILGQGERKDDLLERDFLLAQFSQNNNVAMRAYKRFVKGRMGQGQDFYDLKDQRFLKRR
jgi:hypothetical protein